MKQRGLSTVTINHGNFYSSGEEPISIDLHGLISFLHCFFHSTAMWFNIFPIQYEPVPTKENMMLADQALMMYKSKFRGQLTRFTFFKTSHKLIFKDCDLVGNIVITATLESFVPKFSLYIVQGSPYFIIFFCNIMLKHEW